MSADRFVLRHRALLLVAAVLVPMLLCALLSLARNAIENTNAALVLVLLVVGAASLGLRAAGLLAALSSAVWFDFFLTAPYNRLSIVDRADVETTVLLVLVGVVVSELALWGRRQQGRAGQQRGYLDGVLSAAAQIGTGHDSSAPVIANVERQLVRVLDLDVAQFHEASTDVLPSLQPDGSVVSSGHVLDVDRGGLPTDTELRLAVRNGGVTHGEFRLTAASHVARPTLEERRVAALLADQVGAALAYEHS